MAELTHKPVCLRLQADLEAFVRDIAASQGITVSEWIRLLISNAVYGQAPDVDAGYNQGRAFGLKLAHEMIRKAAELMPQTHEEAVVYFGLAGPGRGHHG
jgi:hypothetical protein